MYLHARHYTGTQIGLSQNKKLATVTMGANVTTIGKNAFYNCIALKKIVIPKTVIKIGNKAFYG